jgi:hypothetical protein
VVRWYSEAPQPPDSRPGLGARADCSYSGEMVLLVTLTRCSCTHLVFEPAIPTLACAPGWFLSAWSTASSSECEVGPTSAGYPPSFHMRVECLLPFDFNHRVVILKGFLRIFKSWECSDPCPCIILSRASSTTKGVNGTDSVTIAFPPALLPDGLVQSRQSLLPFRSQAF